MIQLLEVKVSKGFFAGKTKREAFWINANHIHKIKDVNWIVGACEITTITDKKHIVKGTAKEIRDQVDLTLKNN